MAHDHGAFELKHICHYADEIVDKIVLFAVVDVVAELPTNCLPGSIGVVLEAPGATKGLYWFDGTDWKKH